MSKGFSSQFLTPSWLQPVVRHGQTAAPSSHIAICRPCAQTLPPIDAEWHGEEGEHGGWYLTDDEAIEAYDHGEARTGSKVLALMKNCTLSYYSLGPDRYFLSNIKRNQMKKIKNFAKNLFSAKRMVLWIGKNIYEGVKCTSIAVFITGKSTWW